MNEQHDQTAAAIDAMLEATGLPVSDEERTWLIAQYPESAGVVARLRLPGLQPFEPATVFRAAPPTARGPEERGS